uniref:Uncharacterized protein n=1 Tax=Rhizophora mucronata TaxID=61149 RepID=A0A2P2K6I6_RHIMU
MEKGTKGRRCTSASHRQMRDNVQNRLNDLQQKFFDFQAARKEARIGDVAVLEEQMYRDLCEWKNELDVPSPASSLLGDSIGSFSDDIGRLLQLYEEEDDATSGIAKQSTMKLERGPESDIEGLNLSNILTFQDVRSFVYLFCSCGYNLKKVFHPI